MSDAAKLRKAIRQAICCPSGICGATQPGWNENGPCLGCAAKYATVRAKATLAAIHAAGWRIVPAGATPEMVLAAIDRDTAQDGGDTQRGGGGIYSGIYAAMLAAAPKVTP